MTLQEDMRTTKQDFWEEINGHHTESDQWKKFYAWFYYILKGQRGGLPCVLQKSLVDYKDDIKRQAVVTT